VTGGDENLIDFGWDPNLDTMSAAGLVEVEEGSGCESCDPVTFECEG